MSFQSELPIYSPEIVPPILSEWVQFDKYVASFMTHMYLLLPEQFKSKSAEIREEKLIQVKENQSNISFRRMFGQGSFLRMQEKRCGFSYEESYQGLQVDPVKDLRINNLVINIDEKPLSTDLHLQYGQEITTLTVKPVAIKGTVNHNPLNSFKIVFYNNPKSYGFNSFYFALNTMKEVSQEEINQILVFIDEDLCAYLFSKTLSTMLLEDLCTDVSKIIRLNRISAANESIKMYWQIIYPILSIIRTEIDSFEQIDFALQNNDHDEMNFPRLNDPTRSI